MKKLLLIVLLIPTFCFADARMVLEYERATLINFEMYASDGTLDVDEVDSGTEVTVHCNEDAGTTATNDFVDEGAFYSLSLTAAELACSRVTLSIAATLGHNVFIETCGTPNAQHMNCPGGLYITGGSTASGANTTTETILDTSLTFADDDLNNYLICQVEDQASGDPRQCALITDYVSSTDAATHTAFVAALPNGGEYIVYPDPRTEVNVTGGIIESDVINIEGTDATQVIDGRIDARLAAYGTATNAEVNANEAKIDIIDGEVGAIDSIVDGIALDTGTNGVALADDSITAAVIATDAIGAAEIAANAIGAAEIATDAIDADALAADTIGASEIGNNAITAAKIDADAIGQSEIATNAIGAAEIAPNSIGASELAADAVDEIWDEIIETAGSTYTARCAQAINLAYAAGTWSTSGAVSTFKDPSGASNRIVGTITASTRGSITISCP